MTGTIELVVDDASVMRMLAFARLRQDPVLREELVRLGEKVREAVTAEAPRSPQHRGRGKPLADSFKTRSYAKSVYVRSYKSYGPLIEHGGHTKAHDITPRKAQALTFDGVFAKRVSHPGGSYVGKHFAARAADRMTPVIEEDIANAVARSFE